MKHQGTNNPHTFCFSLNIFLGVQQGHYYVIHHTNTLCLALQLWSALFQVYSFQFMYFSC
jgi:hypothetical protein